MQSLQNKTALITGGSKGIGYGIASSLVQQNVNVAITSRNSEAADKAAEKLNDKNTHFIDVRNEDEYNSGHIPGSIWIPVDQFMQSIDKIPETGNLYFICAAGARSGLACEFSASLSIDEDRLFNIYEGMPTWISKGLPSEQGL